MRFSALAIFFVLLMSILVAFLSCDRGETEDLPSCDAQCEQIYNDRSLTCNLRKNDCMTKCDQDADCEGDCISDWASCLEFTDYETCIYGCDACSKQKAICQEACQEDDAADNCSDQCLDNFYDCTGWARSCFDECYGSYNECSTNCEDYDCLSDCDRALFEQCLPGCVN